LPPQDLIYVDNGKVDQYADWVKSLGYIEVSDAELDKDTYEAAEKQYLGKKCQTSYFWFCKLCVANFQTD
jgi:hypothetical protein